jgi:hypothetical protein
MRKRKRKKKNGSILKIKRLILLATDPAASEHEGRTAAFIAVKKMREENLVPCKVRKGFRAHKELDYSVEGLSRRMDHVEEFISKSKVTS